MKEIILIIPLLAMGIIVAAVVGIIVSVLRGGRGRRSGIPPRLNASNLGREAWPIEQSNDPNLMQQLLLQQQMMQSSEPPPIMPDASSAYDHQHHNNHHHSFHDHQSSPMPDSHSHGMSHDSGSSFSSPTDSGSSSSSDCGGCNCG